MRNNIIAIDLQDADERGIEGIYDEFCSRGYTLSSGYTPVCEDVLDDFYDMYGTSPAYMFCFEDEDGYGVIEFLPEDSRQAARLLDQTDLLTFEQGLRHYGYGY